MIETFPLLQVRGPWGESFQIELNEQELAIGRSPQENDLALERDPQKLVTRVRHCILQRREGGWWVVDRSTNGTFLKREDEMVQIRDVAPLTDGDSILILGRLPSRGDPEYWELAFSDREATQPVNEARYLEYDWVQARLYRIVGRVHEEIEELRPQEHVLIRYMDRRNRENGYVPVMCSYDDLMDALWEDDYGRTKDDVNHVVYRLRQKIEPNDSSEFQFLQTVRGLGYRLITRAFQRGDARSD